LVHQSTGVPAVDRELTEPSRLTMARGHPRLASKASVFWVRLQLADSGLVDHLGDLPDAARRISEGRDATAPRSVDRTIEEGHALSVQLAGSGVGVLDADRAERASSTRRIAHGGRFDEGRGVIHREQVDDEVAQLDDRGIGVLVDDLKTEDGCVELRTGLDVLDE